MRKVVVTVSPKVETKTSKAGKPYRVQSCFASMSEDGEQLLAGRLYLFVRERNGEIEPHPAGDWVLPDGWYLTADGGLNLRGPEFPLKSQLRPVSQPTAAPAAAASGAR